MSNPTSSKRFAAYTDHLKLDQEKLNELLALRDKVARPAEESNGREWRRLRVAGQLWVPAEIATPEGKANLFRAYPIDISTGGISLLVGMFVHTGSRISLKLQLLNGEWVSASGQCVRCALVSGRVHEIGVRFSEPFDTARLLPAEARVELGVIQESAADVRTAALQALAAAEDSALTSGSNGNEQHMNTSMEIKAIAQELLLAVEKSTSKLRRIVGSEANPSDIRK